MENCCTEHANCRCPHHAIVPILITLIGLAFLLQAFAVLSPRFVEIAWPILLVLIGLNKLIAGKCKCC